MSHIINYVTFMKTRIRLLEGPVNIKVSIHEDLIASNVTVHGGIWILVVPVLKGLEGASGA
jgi:hypothetical protein